jgi:hypothetical protein
MDDDAKTWLGAVGYEILLSLFKSPKLLQSACGSGRLK